jgi:hypothetical protein
MADKDPLRQYFTTGYKGQEGILAFNPLPYTPHHSGRGVYYAGPLDNINESYRFVGGPNHMKGFGPAFGPQGRGPHFIRPICEICQKICGNAGGLSRHRWAMHGL